jgi:hypothetical protein
MARLPNKLIALLLTFELLGGLRVVLVLVGMPLQCRFPVCFLDLILCRGRRDPYHSLSVPSACTEP